MDGVTKAFPEEVPMHFIEQFFGFAPDAGSGWLELVLLTVFASFVAIGWRARSLHRLARDEQTAPITGSKSQKTYAGFSSLITRAER